MRRLPRSLSPPPNLHFLSIPFFPFLYLFLLYLTFFANLSSILYIFRQLVSETEYGTSIVQMLFNTSLVAHVGAGEEAGSSQRCLRMINTKRKKEIVRMNYRTPILAVKLNRSRLILTLEKDIYIYDMSNMKLVHIISDTPINPDGE